MMSRFIGRRLLLLGSRNDMLILYVFFHIRVKADSTVGAKHKRPNLWGKPENSYAYASPCRCVKGKVFGDKLLRI